MRLNEEVRYSTQCAIVCGSRVFKAHAQGTTFDLAAKIQIGEKAMSTNY